MGTEILPDLLIDNMKIVFCDTAVTKGSYDAQAYYVNEDNSFYSTLSRLGFTPELINCADFKNLALFGIGLTDLAKYAIGSDSVLKPHDFDSTTLRQRIALVKPAILCFNGKRAASEFFEYGKDTWRVEY
jgi:TDG/mug DNA glycosylase family protein